MNKQTKVILGVLAILIIALVIAIPLYNLYGNDDTAKKTEEQKIINNSNQTKGTQTEDKSAPGTPVTPPKDGDTSTAKYTQENLNEESILSLSWLQNSGEYMALCYQAFNSAKMTLDKILKENSEGKKAIILDVDETVLDNSAYNAGLLGTDKGYSSDTWASWVKAEKATPIPGALEFLKYADSKGINIYYVTNRKAKYDLTQPTINNLKQFEFPQADDKHVILRTDESSKEARRNAIEKDNTVIMLVGDNLDDFDVIFEQDTNKAKREKVKSNMNEFGMKFIVLPNPVYGGWEGALDADYFKKTPQEKSEIRMNSLNKWAQ